MGVGLLKFKGEKMKKVLLLIMLITIVFAMVSCKNIFDSDSSSDINVSNEEIDFSEVNQWVIQDIDSKADIYRNGDFEFIINARGDTSAVTEDSLIIFTKNTNPRFHPVFTAIVICSMFNKYRDSGYEWYKKIIVKNLDYVISRMNDENYIEYCFGVTHCGQFLGEKWISGMSQGEMVAAFVRGYLLTDDEKYLDVAGDFMRTLLRKPDVDQYWCTYVDENNYYWIEEYPNPDKCHVLNGKMYALWGAWEYYVMTRDNDAKNIFQAGLASILDNYREIWIDPAPIRSMYCKHSVADLGYHNIHIGLFESFYNVFQLPELLEAKAAFENQPLE